MVKHTQHKTYPPIANTNLFLKQSRKRPTNIKIYDLKQRIVSVSRGMWKRKRHCGLEGLGFIASLLIPQGALLLCSGLRMTQY